MKYAAIFMCMFASTAVAGITKGKLDSIDTKTKTISVDGETFHYDENTKNRTKDWKPKQGDTIVLSWFNEVDDDFEDIKYVKSFRREDNREKVLRVRKLPPDVKVVENPNPIRPKLNQNNPPKTNSQDFSKAKSDLLGVLRDFSTEGNYGRHQINMGLAGIQNIVMEGGSILHQSPEQRMATLGVLRRLENTPIPNTNLTGGQLADILMSQIYGG